MLLYTRHVCIRICKNVEMGDNDNGDTHVIRRDTIIVLHCVCYYMCKRKRFEWNVFNIFICVCNKTQPENKMYEMSTSIDDLPAPDNTVQENEQEPGIKATIKKKVRFSSEVEEFEGGSENSSDSLLQQLKNLVSEDNIVIVCILVIAALPATTGYITRLPVIGSNVKSELSIAIAKAGLLFVVYIIVSKYIIPKISL